MYLKLLVSWLAFLQTHGGDWALDESGHHEEGDCEVVRVESFLGTARPID